MPIRITSIPGQAAPSQPQNVLQSPTQKGIKITSVPSGKSVNSSFDVIQRPSFMGMTPNKTNGSTPQTNSGTDTLGLIKNIATGVVSSEVGAGQDIAAALGGKSYIDKFSKLSSDQQKDISSLVSLRNKYAKSGDKENTDRINTMIKKENIGGSSVTDMFPSLDKSTEQVLGDFAGIGLDVVTAGQIGPELKAGEEAADVTAKGATTGVRVVKGATKGAAIGAGYGAAGGAQANEGPTDILKSTAIGAGTGAVVGGATEGLLGKRPLNTRINSLIDETSGVADKKSRISALENTGAVDKKGNPLSGTRHTLTGGIHTTPDQAAIDRAKSVEGIVKPGASPVKNLTAVNAEISRISNKEVIPALEKAGPIKPISDKAPGWSTITQRLSDIKMPKMFTADPVLSKTYGLVRDTMIEAIQDEKPTVKGLWDARVAFDKIVKNQFGDAAFDSEKNTAIKRAIMDMRREVNNIIGELVPEYKSQMQRLSNMFDARYNIAENYQDLVNKKGFTGAVKAFNRLNPKTSSVLKWGIGLGATTIAGSAVKKYTGI